MKWGVTLFCGTNMENGELEMTLGSGRKLPLVDFEKEVDQGKHDHRFYTMKREQLLKEYGATEDEVLSDEKGEYVLREPELMDDGDEPEDGRMRRVYLK